MQRRARATRLGLCEGRFVAGSRFNVNSGGGVYRSQRANFLEHHFHELGTMRKAACYGRPDTSSATTRLPWRPLDAYLAGTIAQHGVET